MSKLIERDAAVEVLNQLVRERFSLADGFQFYIDALKDVELNVMALPTVDAVPVRHGRWIRVYSRPGVFKYLGWTCDQCGQRTGNEYAPQWYKFCPNCGARMDGEHDS